MLPWTLFLVALALERTIVVADDTDATCNGYASLCSKAYSNVTFLGAHNSYSVGTSISNNQHYDVTTQLTDGIRLLQGQGHNGTNKAGSMIELCHSACVLEDGGTLEKYLSKVVTWIEANPGEVVTILWVNSDNMPAANWAIAYESTGLARYSYAPPDDQVTAWPSLQSLIDGNTPVVNFLTSMTDHATVPYLLAEWTNIWETPFENTNYLNFTCELNRGTRPNQLYLANHFAYKESSLLGASIDSPNTANIDKTNSVSNVMDHADLCASENSRYPNFFLVDFYEKASGGALEAVASMNDVEYVAKTLGNGKKASAMATFFGGQNEIRNAVIVAVSGFIVLVSVWAIICCCCRRKRRRDQAIPMRNYPKPITSTITSFPRDRPSTVGSHGGQARYKPLENVHEMLATPPRKKVHRPGSSSQMSANSTHTAFHDIRGQGRPPPTTAHQNHPSHHQGHYQDYHQTYDYSGYGSTQGRPYPYG